MTGKAIDVVKRRGKRPTEAFDQKKLYLSIRSACLSVRSLDGQAHDTANKVCGYVVVWCEDKSEITSADIRRQATRALETFHPEAAYIYQHHNVIL